jgi:hypothetical protein
MPAGHGTGIPVPWLASRHRHLEAFMEKPRHYLEKERERIEREEDKVVVNSDESFPASDPPSFNPGVTGAAEFKKKKSVTRH